MNAVLERLLDGSDLDAASAGAVVRSLAGRTIDPAVAGAVLAALRAKGETAEELRGFAAAMRDLARRPPIDAARAVDIVGTGGDGSRSLNLSTGSALLAAACGLDVVKHGNRAVSSACGSADVLEALGYALPTDPAQAAASFRRHRFTFLYAPAFHPAMARIAPVRRALGVRTVFNLLGPLTNPARPAYAVIGAAHPRVAERLAETLAGLDVRRAIVVHGEPGWDEATPIGPFLRLDVRPGRVERRTCDPRFHGIARCPVDALLGGDATYNAARLRDALAGERGPLADALALGAGLALEVAGRAGTLAHGVDLARAALAEGAAGRWLERLIGRSGAREACHG